MDNALLIVIMALEAAVIVWQASKLKQYRALERLLDSQGSTPRQAGAQEATAAAPASVTGPATPAAEADIEDAKRAQGVMARCQYAEFYVEQLDDDHEREQFRSIISSCIDTAAGIDDGFYRSTALEPLVLLLDRAGWNPLRDDVLARVDDDLVRARLDKALAEDEAPALPAV